MSSISLDLGTHDIYFDAIAEQVISDCEEAAMLEALARENASLATQSDDTTEKEFGHEAAKRLRDLAKWFRENQP